MLLKDPFIHSEERLIAFLQAPEHAATEDFSSSSFQHLGFSLKILCHSASFASQWFLTKCTPKEKLWDTYFIPYNLTKIILRQKFFSPFFSDIQHVAVSPSACKTFSIFFIYNNTCNVLNIFQKLYNYLSPKEARI